MKRKIDAGCQFFPDPAGLLGGGDRYGSPICSAKTGAKILVGIMPLVSYRNALFIKNEMPGIHVPDAVLARYQSGGQPGGVGADGARHVSGQRDGHAAKDVGAGYYFMTPFHRVALIQRIMENCLPGSGGAAGVRAAEESEMCGQ